ERKCDLKLVNLFTKRSILVCFHSCLIVDGVRGRNSHPHSGQFGSRRGNIQIGLLSAVWTSSTQYYHRLQRHRGRDKVLASSSRDHVRLLVVLRQLHP